MTQIFKKEVSTKTTAVVFGVLIIACLFAFYVSAAWNEPTQNPPLGNVPAPINVGPTAQEKTGTLTVPIIYDKDNTSYWMNPGGIQIFAGPVGIGPTNAPFHKLEIAGVVKFGPASQPTEYVSDGLMYYDQSLNRFRCYQNGWVDCVGGGGTSGTSITCSGDQYIRGAEILNGVLVSAACAAPDPTGPESWVCQRKYGEQAPSESVDLNVLCDVGYTLIAGGCWRSGNPNDPPGGGPTVVGSQSGWFCHRSGTADKIHGSAWCCK